MTSYTVKVEEDPVTGDLYIPLPQDLLDELGWVEGDVIEWVDKSDGSYQLIKQQVTNGTADSTQT